jgi:hypothetical protein
MSMRPRALPEVPAPTAAVARAAFARGSLAIRIRDELGEVFFDAVIPKYFGEGTELKYPVPFAYHITVISASGSRNYLVANQPNWTHWGACRR